jgi:hypothetical protein
MELDHNPSSFTANSEHEAPSTNPSVITSLQSNQHTKSGRARKFIYVFLLIILIAAIAGSIYAWQHNKVSAANKQVISLTTEVTSLQKQIATLQGEAKTSTITPQPTSTNTSTNALGLVQSAYNTVFAYEKKYSGVSQAEVDTIKSDLSTNLYNKLSSDVKSPSSDPILCGQALPNSTVAVSGQTNNGVSTVLVNEAFGTTAVQVTTTVDLSSLKITGITCPSS